MGSQYTSAVPAIVPDEEDLPGWVPKNYIEKGEYKLSKLLVLITAPYMYTGVSFYTPLSV